MNPLMKFDWQRLNPSRRQPRSTLLGMSLDGCRLECLALRRSNDSVKIEHSFVTTLSLDPLTNPPELVGREIRKVLDEHGIRERWCTVSLPLNWALTLSVAVPELPEEDINTFLQVEAERGFPYAQDALVTVQSRYRTDSGATHATMVAVPRNHLERLESVLVAAQLKPASFSIGIMALQPANSAASEGVLALLPGVDNIRMQLTVGGGVALLRTIEGAFESEGKDRQLHANHVLRELRITLGQLAPELRDAVKRIKVLGNNEDAEELAETLESWAQDQGLLLEHERYFQDESLGLTLPAQSAVSPALALVVRRLAGARSAFEFLPPKVSSWEKFSSKYSSPKLVTVGASAGAVAAAVLLAFFIQQMLLWYWGHRWSRIKERALTLEDTQANIRKYRTWYDGSFRELSILRRITESFPEDGTVSMKQVEIRDPSKAGELPLITCTGTARDRAALLRVREKLSQARGVENIHTEQERGSSPIEFTFNFQWSEGRP